MEVQASARRWLGLALLAAAVCATVLLLAGGPLLLQVRQGASAPRRKLLGVAKRRNVGAPRFNDSVLPGNTISQRLPVVNSPYYGVHVFGLGANGSLFHKFQTGHADMSSDIPFAPMSDWHCLTPNKSLVFGNDPAVALNADGHIELFAGLTKDSYDLWQMYQTDPKNPLAWSKPRGPTCMCDATDPSACPWCMDCNARVECYSNYWLDHAPFTTSDVDIFLDAQTQKLKLLFRNFDGHMYSLEQQKPGDSTRWSNVTVQYAVFE
eukprot:gnl/TRDRNA2_/TRDRNA2_197637_c0_seq1.p1 gnl/TRDRNA2_/TRDRNA2_197637_c0~~gnl/TRDRNA2_/TRDRNA2_197637_c0_seq1.p1  ORF type:complete len:265 (-),score=24.27 gnl/TRDRNA2_/TRDRNA2_197637_c0_seq1:75-869(-)